jgi:hypothetical protein
MKQLRLAVLCCGAVALMRCGVGDYSDSDEALANQVGDELNGTCGADAGSLGSELQACFRRPADGGHADPMDCIRRICGPADGGHVDTFACIQRACPGGGGGHRDGGRFGGFHEHHDGGQCGHWWHEFNPRGDGGHRDGGSRDGGH